MAENGVDIAKAYVHLIPSFEGGQGAIADALIPSASKAGDGAGSAAGSKFSGSFGKGLAALAGAAAVTGAFTGLWKIAESFDDVADTIRIGTGATGEALDGLVDVAKNVGKTVPAEFGDIGTAVADINTRMGLTGDTLQTVASQYLQAGNILGESVDIGKTSAAFSAFKITGDDVSGAMDHLFQVSQATGVGMNDLAASVQKNAPAVQALGFNFEETAVLVGSLDKAGLNSSAVMASMSKSLVTLAKDGEAPKDAFKRVTGELQGFIASGDEAGAINLAAKVFGTKGASQFVGALKSGSINLDDLSKAAGQTSDSILGTAADTADFAESWQLVKNNAMLALEPLASNVFGQISGALAGAMPMLQQFGAWLSENTWVLGVVAGIIGATLVGAFVAWTASIWAANAALLANPITWLILIIVALVAGIIYLATQTTFFQDVWSAVWGFIQATITNAGNLIGTVLSWISTTWAAVWGFVSSVAMAVWSGIVGFITGYINTIRTIITVGVMAAQMIWANTWNLVSSVASAIWGGIVGFITGYINTVRAVISNVLGAISSIWAGAWNGISSFVSGAWNGIIGFFSGAIGTVSGIFQSIANSIMSPFRNAFNAIAGFWNGTVGQISFKIPDWVPGVGGNGWSVPSIPMLAEGGVITRPTLAVVGEAGPEAVIPLSKLSQHLPEGVGGKAGGGDVIFNGNVGWDPYEIANRIETKRRDTFSVYF
ncbi:phage tail tape measure protein, TP901 family, core region [Arthrobacter alpinus]|uniref:Phage tail tape measure protein, TP901 family, core region n=1 Tax=Arthrobacter alpinus TaxID=656366 RepID=A0A1H5LZA7_9MICC|nr:phage tail tape measure protein [Arthrobacter alpinus]SEE82346.1 phage tail tape measure protein, TP901 family, core region [Arthrobacter alpinus]